MSSAAAAGEIAVGRFMRCYRGKSRGCGARRFFFIAYPGLTAWAKLWRASGASEWGGTGEEAGEARRGHGYPVPLQRQDAAFGLGALKRRPHKGRMRFRLGIWGADRGLLAWALGTLGV